MRLTLANRLVTMETRWSVVRFYQGASDALALHDWGSDASPG
jgi:hypothetical protein